MMAISHLRHMRHMQVPSPKDIQKKLDKPLAAIPSPKDLANTAKTKTPNAGNVASKVEAHMYTSWLA